MAYAPALDLTTLFEVIFTSQITDLSQEKCLYNGKHKEIAGNTNRMQDSVTDRCKANRSYCPYFASDSEESEEEELEEEEAELSLSLSTTTFASYEFLAFFSLPFLPNIFQWSTLCRCSGMALPEPTIAPQMQNSLGGMFWKRTQKYSIILKYGRITQRTL